MDCLSGAAVAISDELVSSITQVVNLFLEGKCPTILGEYIASAPLTPLVKIRRWHSSYSWGVLILLERLVSDRFMSTMIGLSLEGSFWMVFSLVFGIPGGAWYLDDGTIVGDNLVVGKVLELIAKDGPRCGLHLNVDKTELFWPKENLRSRLEGVFPPNISRPLHVVKLLGGPVSVDPDFSNALVTKRVSKTIGLLDVVAKINDPQCELLLIHTCAGISKLYFAMRTCPSRVFESAQLAFDMALRSALERIVTAFGLGFCDWQWRLATLPFAFGGLGVYSAGDVLNYAFVSSCLQSAALQTRLLRHVGLAAYGSTFDDALCVFNTSMKIDFLGNPSEIAAPKLMKKMADIYFTRVIKDAKSSFDLSSRQMALWQYQREEHTSDWLHVVPISGLGQTMNDKTYRCVLCYRLSVPLFAISKACSACSKVFTGDVYGDHAVSCTGVIGIKHRQNAMHDTLVDICFRSGISAGKEVDIGLGGGCDKALRPADMLLYSWEGGLDMYVDLTGSSPLTQTRMADFMPGRAVIDAAQRKRGKYMTKCADIEYGFLPFSFSSFGELEKDAVTLLKRVRKFSMAQDIGARAAVHIFNRISFSIAKGVGAQIVSRLPSNLFDNYIIVEGKWLNSTDNYYLINMYGPPHQPDKENIWESLRIFAHQHVGQIILFGDLNEVRHENERFGTMFSSNDVLIFNSFIDNVCLIDLPLGGKIYTWMNTLGTKLSKLDRFLVSDGVLNAHPHLQATVLDKVWSNHNPMLLHCKYSDFGPIPFKLFHSWFDRKGFNDTVKEVWNSNSTEVHGFHGKLQCLKSHLKLWYSRTKESEYSTKRNILLSLKNLEDKIDAGCANDEDRQLRVNKLLELEDLDKLESMDLIQKARLKRDVKGDENSKKFHGIINSKRKSQMINGILHEGEWITDPKDIKTAFLNFYKAKFSCHDSPVIFPPIVVG
ncbi:ankyrin repeat-containing protein ITN1-like protein, partial [Tanacetum coccineum]